MIKWEETIWEVSLDIMFPLNVYVAAVFAQENVY